MDPVERALEALFPAEKDRAQARGALATYGVEPHEQEEDRVRLAILKLAEEKPAILRQAEARLAAVVEFVGIAKRDFRDVLMWAETPGLGRSNPALWLAARRDPAARQALDEMEQRDCAQSAAWLDRFR